MKLVRGWESQYAPAITGKLRMTQAICYRDIGEDGIGDQREGEVRARVPETLTVRWQREEDFPVHATEEMDDAFARQLWELLDDKKDDRAIISQGPGTWTRSRDLKLEDSQLGSPFILCLSREPTSRAAWERLQAALPDRYDFWTVTEDVESLDIEIRCGIRRWISLNKISAHCSATYRDWVNYSYDVDPRSVDLDDLNEAVQIERWFRKSNRFSDQEEYRIAWSLLDPQCRKLPEAIEIELTRAGIDLFKPWTPPER